MGLTLGEVPLLGLAEGLSVLGVLGVFKSLDGRVSIFGLVSLGLSSIVFPGLLSVPLTGFVLGLALVGLSFRSLP